MNTELYPLVFEPILKDRIWGGAKLKTMLGKKVPTQTTGESWELSAVDDAISIVKDGAYKGMAVTELLGKFPVEILGTKVHEQFGNKFPLLFKFLDAKEDLSIQVHPNDELAKKRHNSFGKTEMWYVMQADKGATIIVGFKENSSPEEYLEHLKSKNLLEILNEVEVKEGDVHFLETGTVHAIRGGIVIAEIQQTSDITYRVYDWDRKDANGKSRELHIDEALDAINYNETVTQKQYSKKVNRHNTVVNSPYFTTDYIPLNGTLNVYKDGSNFTVYICTEGNFSIKIQQKTYSFKMGDTVLIPAIISDFALTGKATLLEIYIS